MAGGNSQTALCGVEMMPDEGMMCILGRLEQKLESVKESLSEHNDFAKEKFEESDERVTRIEKDFADIKTERRIALWIGRGILTAIIGVVVYVGQHILEATLGSNWWKH